jgi:hypothetical protein
MQRPRSCQQQEQEVRKALPRYGLDPDTALVLQDNAESGTKAERDGGFEALGALIAREPVILAVDDQSRMSRADNASAFIQDIVYGGGRFISTEEGIDTAQKGWELRVKVLEIHNSQTIRDLANRVRRGQRDRILCDGSAGDHPFGYESFYLNPNWPELLKARGPKPEKGLRICESEARWVRQVFAWFIAGKSINLIARELTRLGVPKDHRTNKPGWHPQQVRRMLENEKYVGRWRWGETTTVRNSKGKKKQVAVPATEQTYRERQNLRIIDDETWAKAQSRLAELKDKFGSKPGQKKRGPRRHASEVYPRSLLGGLLVCRQPCGANLQCRGSGERRYYACSAHQKGLCDIAAQVPADKAEQALTTFLLELLSQWPEWLQGIYQRVKEQVREAAAGVPEQHELDKKRLAEVDRQKKNLVLALAGEFKNSAAVKEGLDQLEDEARRLEKRIAANEILHRGAAQLPDDAWLAGELCRWATGLNGDIAQAANILRRALGRVEVHPVIAPGKKRGYTQLRFRVCGWALLQTVLGNQVPDGLPMALDECLEEDESPEFMINLGQPTALESWASQIAAWRAEEMTWKEIVERTGLDLNRAYIAWKRYVQAQEKGGGET